MTAPDARNVFGWVMVGGALVVAFAVGVVLAARWPFAAVLVVSHAAVAAVTWWRTDRGLREEVAGLAERHDAWNRQAKSTDLAEVGPLIPPRGDRQVAMHDHGSALDPLTAIYDTADPAAVDQIRIGAENCGCDECLTWLIRNGFRQAARCARFDDAGVMCGRLAEGCIREPHGDVWLCAIHYAAAMEGVDR